MHSAPIGDPARLAEPHQLRRNSLIPQFTPLPLARAARIEIAGCAVVIAEDDAVAVQMPPLGALVAALDPSIWIEPHRTLLDADASKPEPGATHAPLRTVVGWQRILGYAAVP